MFEFKYQQKVDVIWWQTLEERDDKNDTLDYLIVADERPTLSASSIPDAVVIGVSVPDDISLVE
jgi:hypothetical protein